MKVLRRLGAVLEEEKDYDGAIAKYQQVLALDPKNQTLRAFSLSGYQHQCNCRSETIVEIRSPLTPTKKSSD
jgi:hypothetical protein